MLRYNMTVVTPDNRLKRAIKRVTTATGSTAQFVPDASGLDPAERVDLAIVDAREGTPSSDVPRRLGRDTAIAYILDGDSLQQKINLLADQRVCSLLCHDERFDDDEFIASSTKALRHEVFGLQKYFPWGVTTFSMVVQNYDHKTRAIEIIMDYAKRAGVRGPVRDRIQLVSDELMMNALYHAPVDEHGNELYANMSRKEMAQLDQVSAIEVQYGCSGRYFGISVRDGGGSLSRTKALDYLQRAQNGTADIEEKATGAGLGLLSVLRSVSKLVFNLQPGSSTEVIALFDMDLFARGKVGARSLHIFVAEPEEDDDEDDTTVIEYDPADEAEPAPVPQLRSSSGAGKWMLLALLFAIAAALGTAFFMKNQQSKAAGDAAGKLFVVPSPADATIKLNNQPTEANQAIELRPGKGTFELSVDKDQYTPWKARLTPTDDGTLQLRIELTKPAAGGDQ